MTNNYNDKEYGIWNIFGEDPNCDFGGFHHTPFLETVEGTYEEVLAYAKTLNRFYTWGGGGHLVKQVDTTIKKIEGYAEVEKEKEKAKLEKEMKELQEKMDKINDKLKNL